MKKDGAILTYSLFFVNNFISTQKTTCLLNIFRVKYKACGRGGMVDTLVLEANAKSVKVQVLSPAPKKEGNRLPFFDICFYLKFFDIFL